MPTYPIHGRRQRLPAICLDHAHGTADLLQGEERLQCALMPCASLLTTTCLQDAGCLREAKKKTVARSRQGVVENDDMRRALPRAPHGRNSWDRRVAKTPENCRSSARRMPASDKASEHGPGDIAIMTNILLDPPCARPLHGLGSYLPQDTVQKLVADRISDRL